MTRRCDRNAARLSALLNQKRAAYAARSWNSWKVNLQRKSLRILIMSVINVRRANL